jgi:hypothetical protein
MGPAVRVNPTNGTGYAILYLPETQRIRFGTVVGTTFSAFGGNQAIEANRRVSVGDKLTLRAVGNRLTVYYNGVAVLSTTNNSYTSGQAGFFYQPDNIRATLVDDFKVRSLQNSMRITSTGNRGRIIGRAT